MQDVKILKNAHLCTVMQIWTPRYSDKYKNELSEPVALLSQSKVHHASPEIIVKFTKAKHLQGQRFTISREKAQKAPVDSNGKISCYAVPLSWFEPYITSVENRQHIIDTLREFKQEGWL